MKLEREFYQLPLHFDVERLQAEVSQFAETEWRDHPEGHKGNTALPLVALHGDPDNNGVIGPMQPTAFLDRCPYIQQVFASFQSVLGRSRLMRIAGGGEATAHSDTNYYWQQRVRIHVPVITFPEVRFLCGDKSVHMAAGEAWIFDTWRKHNVINGSDRARIHLVTDTVGSAEFWDLVAAGERGVAAEFVPYQRDRAATLQFERFNFPAVMSPWELSAMADLLLSDARRSPGCPPERVKELEVMMRRFLRHWRSLWAQYADTPAGFDAYRAALERLKAQLDPLRKTMTLANGSDAVWIAHQFVTFPALHPEVQEAREKQPIVVPLAASTPVGATSGSVPAIAPPQPISLSKDNPAREFDRPIFIVAAPRSGSSLLFELLARSPSVWTVGGESHPIFEGIAKLQPKHRHYDSNCLAADDADPDTAATLVQNFRHQLRDRLGTMLPAHAKGIRLLEKTPKNALRIPFLRAIFPDALFVYLYRDPRENIGSILEAWQSGKFVMYRDLPGWKGLPWSMLLIPEWRQLNGKPLIEVAAAQWESAHRHILNDLEPLPRDRWCGVSYGDLLADPQRELQRICEFAQIDWEELLEAGNLPLSRHTLTPPAPDKWKRHEAEILSVLDRVAATDRRVRAALGLSSSDRIAPTSSAPAAIATPSTHSTTVHQSPSPAPAATIANDPNAPLRSVFTNTFAEVLKKCGVSLLISTYQAGKLITARMDGDRLNTHFRIYNKPMGLAATRDKLAIGSAYQIFELRNVPAVAQKLDPPGKHDACFMQRNMHVTGDIDIHEMAYIDEELWFVNTRFSCLCTLDRAHSFVPRWRPPFVTAYDLSDRCHLNGLAVRDNQPRYMTMLGETDTAGGWRANKASGGLLMDITTNDVLRRGLSMPHSPRWYRDRLWVLESGQGSLSWLDLATGKLETVTQLPGFTRGIDFYGNIAFIGLSQVRETAVFSGIPITERLTERICGVWAVNIDTGETLGFLRFEDAVQEIFSVIVLPGIRFPEVLDWNEDLLKASYVLPDEALKEVQITLPPPKTESEIERHFREGNDCYMAQKLDEAMAHYEKCLELKPEFVQARYNLGVVLRDLDRTDEAIALFEQVLREEPNYAEAYNNLGVIADKFGRIEEAEAYYRRAIAAKAAKNEAFPDAHLNLAMTLLKLGRFAEGWTEYEWRWQTVQCKPLECPLPKWDGEDLTDKRILVHTEQGSGDSIQFARYLPLLRQRCKEVLLACPESLNPLLQTVEGVDRLIPPGNIPTSEFDTYTPLMSLARIFGTTEATIPAQVPYLTPPAQSAAADRIAGDGNLKVGIVWAGSPTHRDDRYRSAAIEEFLPLLRVPGVSFYSLQKGAREGDVDQLPADAPVTDLSPYLTTYADTAAAIAKLDLVIGVDTSVVHLAGALGKPVWVLLAFTADWRWLRDRDDSPWYPTARLFRQSHLGEWQDVLERASRELAALVAARQPKPLLRRAKSKSR